MSPELETLDQLLGGELPLIVIRSLFPDDARFRQGILGLLRVGEVRLLTASAAVVPDWRVEHLFKHNDLHWLEDYRIGITEQGAARIR